MQAEACTANQLLTPSTTGFARNQVWVRGNDIKQERFASPLNFNPDIHEYWSAFPEDELFGAEKKMTQGWVVNGGSPR